MNRRRKAVKKIITAGAAFLSLSMLTKAGLSAHDEQEKISKETLNFQDTPLLSYTTIHDNLVYVYGAGAHDAPFTIRNHTEYVLGRLEKALIEAGSSMEKVLKVSVFLADIADYQGMNEVYKGRFGKRPPVRTTVAVGKGALPKDSLVEIDCIAYV